MPISRRRALQAGGALGLLGLGAGTASATTGTGQIGTESNSVDAVFTNTLTNSVSENINIIAKSETSQSTIQLGTESPDNGVPEFVRFSLHEGFQFELTRNSVRFNVAVVNLDGTDLFDSNSDVTIWDSENSQIPVDALDIDAIAAELTIDEEEEVTVENNDG